MNFFAESAYFGIAVSLAAYGVGCFIRKKLKNDLFNPLIISIAIIILLLSVTDITYEDYYSGADILGWLLTPATVCLAVPLYEKLQLLKSNAGAVIAGIAAGVVTSMVCVLGLAAVFGFSHEEYVTFLPKSVTTAIGIDVSREMGGFGELTTAVIIITGVAGNVTAPLVCRLAGITEPVAKGIAIGTSAHAMGTSKAMEMGETEGAVSSLAIAVAGIMTVGAASVFAQLY